LIDSISTEALQQKITIEVNTTYLSGYSKPDEDHYAFAYTISIHNGSDTSLQLLSRHWIITDGNNAVEEVRGEGVVGEQPVIRPGKIFTYTSGATLTTPVGSMEGSYTMAVYTEIEPMLTFDVTIPGFTLHRPQALH
jgi:ApaG protein